MTNLGIRGRLILLVLAIALPAVALALYDALAERATAEARARADLERIATLAAPRRTGPCGET